MKFRINKITESGAIITGYEEILTGTREECEQDYRNYHDWAGPVDVQEKI